MKIKLSDDGKVTLDLDKAIESRVLIQANSGGGKSYTGRRFIEQTFGHKQLIIIDPEGEFSNMRQAFDFVYIAKDGGDAPAEVHSAALLARRLLETKANAIIDIYELGSQRGDFVKAFFDATVNMPKDLWQDCFYLLDEAHKFAPEKGQGESVALQSVIDMASLGRKRGYCLIPMTQRPAKLSKDVVAECNNKLIGRASLDIDRERSAKELGFHSKEDILSLRDLEPGEFYVFGPAISRDVIKTTIGDVKIKPPKRGTRAQRIAPPTDKVKKILAELADLPQAAEKEAKTTKELTEALRVATRRIETLQQNIPAAAPIDAQALTNAVQKAAASAMAQRDKEWAPVLVAGNKEIRRLANIIENVRTVVGEGGEDTIELVKPPSAHSDSVSHETKPVNTIPVRSEHEVARQRQLMPAAAPTGDMKPATFAILKTVASDPEGLSTDDIAILTGYKGTSRYIHLGELMERGYIEKRGDLYHATIDGASALGSAYEPRPTGQALQDQVLSRMQAGDEKRALEFLIREYPRSVDKTELGDFLAKKGTSVYLLLKKLNAQKLITLSKGIATASDKLF